MEENRIIENHNVRIYLQGNQAPVIYWGSHADSIKEFQSVIEELKAIVQDLPFCLVMFEAEEWNRDFSPWEAPPLYGDVPFGGHGRQTYEWLTQKGIPQIEQLLEGKIVKERYLAGYSLAGLFALWAFVLSAEEKNPLFTGAASCSGSLWYPGWFAFLEQHPLEKRDSLLYLSLGGKEEKTKHPLMASVGNATRETYDRISRNEAVRRCILEWNNGGHFTNPEKRLAKGMAWLLRNQLMR